MVWLAACGAVGVHAFTGQRRSGQAPGAPRNRRGARDPRGRRGISISSLAVVVAGLRSSADGDRRARSGGSPPWRRSGSRSVTIAGSTRSQHPENGHLEWSGPRTLTDGSSIARFVLPPGDRGSRWNESMAPSRGDGPSPTRGRSAAPPRAEIAFAVLAIVDCRRVMNAAASRGRDSAAASKCRARLATAVKATAGCGFESVGTEYASDVALEGYDSGASMSRIASRCGSTPIDDPEYPRRSCALSKDAEGVFDRRRRERGVRRAAGASTC